MGIGRIGEDDELSGADSDFDFELNWDDSNSFSHSTASDLSKVSERNGTAGGGGVAEFATSNTYLGAERRRKEEEQKSGQQEEGQSAASEGKGGACGRGR